MKKIFYFISLLLLCIAAWAQPATPSLRFGRLGTDKGLSNATVYCSFMDSQGYLWFGSEDGLNKYDGYTFDIYKSIPSDSSSLSNNIIRCIFEDSHNNLYVGTDNGLNQYNRVNGSFTRFMHDAKNKNSISNNLIYAMCEDHSGTVWIGTSEGLNAYNISTGKFTTFDDVLQKTILLSSNFITAIHADEKNNLWIGTAKNGVNIYNMTSKTLEILQHDEGNSNSLTEDEITCLFEDKSGNEWIGTLNGGVNKYNPATKSFSTYTKESTDGLLGLNSIFTIASDQSGVLWIGTMGGGLTALELSTGKISRYSYDAQNLNSISSDKIWNIFEDHAGTIWYSTANGVSSFNRSVDKFVTYKYTEATDAGSNNNVFCVHEDADGNAWCGILGSNGLKIFDRQEGKFVSERLPKITEPVLLDKNIFCIAEDDNHLLWIGTEDGLVSLEKKSGNAKVYRNATGSSSGSNAIRSIAVGKAGVFWIGTYGGGLSKFDSQSGTFTSYTNNPSDAASISSNVIMDVKLDNDGNVWMATYGGGICVFRPSSEKFTSYQNDPSNPQSISSNFIHCLHKDSKGTWWIGTYGGGLDAFNQSTGDFISYTESAGLPNNIVNGILEDEKGNLWISTNNGICKFSTQTKDVRDAVLTSRTYKVEDGLQNKFNENACFKGKNGWLYFGGSNGLNVFNPDNIKDNAFIPPIVITRFYLFEKPQRMDTLITSEKIMMLNYSQNSFSFEYAALNYLFPEKNRYAYMVDGLDKDWHYIGTRHYTAYTNLDPGHYVFRVKACNNDGYWNEEGISIDITITPPFWKTWWFMTASAFFIAFIIFGYIQFRTRSLRKQTVVLEERVTRRTHELSEKNTELTATMTNLRSTQDQLIQSEKMASLGQLTAGIAHEIQNPLNFVNNFSESSIEMLEEVETSNDPLEQKELISDVKLNLEKVVHHGKRADSIVKGMLMHSRTGVSEKQITDINKLVTEFVDLAYHGMRAKDSGFNCNIEKDLGKDLPKVKVIPQDISRVVLNIFNNAFYAVEDRKKSEGEDYKRIVSVRTYRTGNKVGISIRDNGKGIPMDVKDKIFEPFFTTKPTGQGTGLGLSISYDIITKGHQGDLRVESKPGEFTEFIIELPSV
ncbi:MAG: two-component regulator propeller domain-containing protein [Bacteroidota bacterium]